MRILVVEDEIRIRKGMAKLIEHHTEHVVIGEAKNGREGMEMAIAYQPDLIITDIRMPEMDGLEMLRRLREKGGAWRFVILSGYSEFEYAKQAIRYGVDDYLIKPLAAEDVIKLLNSVEEKIKKEFKKTQEKPEKKLRDLLIENEPADFARLEAVCEIKKEDTFRLLCAYVGVISIEERTWCMQVFGKLAERFDSQKLYYFFTESTKEFICLTEEKNWDFIRQELERKILQKSLYACEWVWTTASVKGLGNLKEAYEQLKKLYIYGLALGNQNFITGQSVADFQPREEPYPKNMEKRLQKAFYKEDKEEFQEAAAVFGKEIYDMGIKPVQIKEEYMQVVNFLMNLAKEGNRSIYEQLQNLNTIRHIGMAVTKGELENIFDQVVHAFVSNMNHRQDISNYTIKRAIDYIRNHYQESISLEGTAACLAITPEYLSTLFNREMGQNFSVFLKKFRISHAKRLLKGTDKKIYEIAAEVGYTDPKYFNRVFKEEEGISPGDYRSLQK